MEHSFWNSLTTHIEERTELSIEQASAETLQLQPPESQPEQVANESPQELKLLIINSNWMARRHGGISLHIA